MALVVETREEAIAYLESRINYERMPARKKGGGGFKLERMRSLLSLLGNPQERIPAVHIAGTKGKGSTAAMTAAMLSSAGYRTGLFTSPHVSAFEERMQADGRQPSEAELVELVNTVAAPAEAMERTSAELRPTYFELATAMAWLYFARKRCEIAVIEVGLGGRLDSTNLCRPEVVVITNISHDHTAVLGRRLPQIAREKAGIVKPGVPVLSGVRDRSARKVIVEICRQNAAPLYELGKEIRFHRPSSPASAFHSRGRSIPGGPPQVIDAETPWRCWPAVAVPLAGEHQAANAALALGVVDVLQHLGRPLAAAAARRGLAAVRWPVRIEVVRQRPTVVIDAAHNGASAGALAKTLRADFSGNRRILVFAATKDKDVAGMLRRLVPQFDEVILTRYRTNPRGLPLNELKKVYQSISPRPASVAANPEEAWQMALEQAAEDDLVCITGSFFIAAEMRDLLLPRMCDAPVADGTGTISQVESISISCSPAQR